LSGVEESIKKGKIVDLGETTLSYKWFTKWLILGVRVKSGGIFCKKIPI
jgi:hypothetical protein